MVVCVATSCHPEEQSYVLRALFPQHHLLVTDSSVFLLFVFSCSGPVGSLPIENVCLQHVLPNYVDVWAELHDLGSEQRFTFDGSVNSWVPPQRFGVEQMRYDRVLVRTPEHWQPTAIEMFGREEIPEHKCCPSDHFGLICRLGV
jgi:hypothetical protein